MLKHSLFLLEVLTLCQLTANSILFPVQPVKQTPPFLAPRPCCISSGMSAQSLHACLGYGAILPLLLLMAEILRRVKQVFDGGKSVWRSAANRWQVWISGERIADFSYSPHLRHPYAPLCLVVQNMFDYCVGDDLLSLDPLSAPSFSRACCYDRFFSRKVSCAAGAPLRMKRDSMDDAATLGTKDPNSESDVLTKARELVRKAVFGHLEEPFIVAPSFGSTERKFSCGKMPCWRSFSKSV
jgi:hypothetical protein